MEKPAFLVGNTLSSFYRNYWKIAKLFTCSDSSHVFHWKLFKCHTFIPSHFVFLKICTVSFSGKFSLVISLIREMKSDPDPSGLKKTAFQRSLFMCSKEAFDYVILQPIMIWIRTKMSQGVQTFCLRSSSYGQSTVRFVITSRIVPHEV